MHNKVMGGTGTCFTEVYAYSLNVDCDLDLSPRDMVLVRGTLSCHDDHLYRIILKSHHVVMARTRFWNTQTHTHGQGKLYMPFRHFIAGA